MKIMKHISIKYPVRTALCCLAIILMGAYAYDKTHTAFATTMEWTSVTIPPTGSYFESVAASTDGTRLAIAGNGTYIYTSADSGTTWTARTAAGSRSWTSITSSADGVKLAASDGSGGYLYTSADGGATWTARGVQGSLTTVTSSSDGTRLVMAGIGTPIYTSTDSGATWTAHSGVAGGGGFMIGTEFWGASAVSADGNKIMVINTSLNWVFASTNGGSTWNAIFKAPDGTNAGLSGITSSADGTKLAVTAYSGNIYTSADGGATWTARTPPLESGSTVNNWGGISSSADGTRLAAVSRNSYIYTSFDSGATWNSNTSSPQIGAMAKGTQYHVAYSADGSTIAVPFVGGQGIIYIGKDHNANCDWVGYYPPAISITSPYPGQPIEAGTSFRIQGSVAYHMTTASAENVTIGWSNHDGTQSGSQLLYSTSSSCTANGCPNSDNTSDFSLAGYATSSPAITAPTTPGTYRFYVYATSTNSCTTDVMSAYQDYEVSQAGQCGTKSTDPVTQFDKNHPVTGTSCSIGSEVNGTQAGSSHNWQCSGVNGGATSSMCTYIYNDPVNGVCGPDNGVPVDTVPTGLCYVGTSTSPTAASSSYTWSCLGSNYGTTASCSAPISDLSTAFKLISSLADSQNDQCTAQWNVTSSATDTISCVLNGGSVPLSSSGYKVQAGVVTLTCTQGAASSTKNLKCQSNPKYIEI